LENIGNVKFGILNFFFLISRKARQEKKHKERKSDSLRSLRFTLLTLEEKIIFSIY